MEVPGCKEELFNGEGVVLGMAGSVDGFDIFFDKGEFDSTEGVVVVCDVWEGL